MAKARSAPSAATAETAPSSDLARIQKESLSQALPQQEQVFAIARRVRQRLSNLPDPTEPPLGFEKGKGFDAVFPFVRLPVLTPSLNGDWVQFGSSELEPNRLYYGDNLQVLRTLPSESIDLIYIDPPFFSGAVYNVIWGDANEVRTFNDIWDGGLKTYLIWLNARLWEMRRVLKSTGSIFVHCDWHASHYIKTELDRIFGYGESSSGTPTAGFRNEIAWCYRGGGVPKTALAKKHDVILWYTKSGRWKFNVDRIRIPYSEESLERLQHTARSFRKSGTYDTYRPNEFGKHPEDWWQIQPLMPSEKTERIGYPTQKPIDLLQRIVEGWSDPGDTVADFFCGGGSFIAAAAGLRSERTDDDRPALHAYGELTRRWIASDISRVAVSVTLDRLVKVCEEQSGVISNYGKAAGTEIQRVFPKVKVPDIRLGYVGVYPVDRFRAVDRTDFVRFILQCFDASPNTAEEPIHGWRSQAEPVLVGPADPGVSPDPKEVRAFFEASLKHIQPNTPLTAYVVAWKFSPALAAYAKELRAYAAKNLLSKGIPFEIELVPINSQKFRERIARKFADAADSEFLLRFANSPMIGEIAVKRAGPLKYRFEAKDADATNLDGWLVNCQWDFDYQRGHFSADREYVLGRVESKAPGRKYEAVLAAEHAFEKAGKVTVACKVQDNLGGDAIGTVEVTVR